MYKDLLQSSYPGSEFTQVKKAYEIYQNTRKIPSLRDIKKAQKLQFFALMKTLIKLQESPEKPSEQSAS